MWGETIAAWWVWAMPVALITVLAYVLNSRRKKQFDHEARRPVAQDLPDCDRNRTS